MLADAATFAAAEQATDIHFRARFDKRKIRRPEAQFQILLEEILQESGQDATQVRHADTLIHQQTFHLVKHRRMRDIVVVPESASRCDDADRRALLQHGANLHRRCMRAQQLAATVKIKRIHVRARGMIGLEIQCIEIMEVVFDFRTGGNAETHAVKQLADTFDDTRDRMQATRLMSAARARYIDGFFREFFIQRSACQRCLLRFQQ